MSKNILVVDDEPAIARLVQMSLAVEGYEVVTAHSGFEALEQIEKKMPDLIILDVMMPGMSGFDLCVELKQKPKTRSIIIVFLTALGNQGDAQRGLGMGGKDFIMKPFDPEELLEKVKSFVGPGIA